MECWSVLETGGCTVTGTTISFSNVTFRAGFLKTTIDVNTYKIECDAVI